MRNEVLYHGADGDSILGIIGTGTMSPAAGKVFFAKHRWEDALMHGADTRRRASFVVKVNVAIPEQVVSYQTATPGVAMTLVVETIEPLRTEVLELYVRKPTAGGFDVHHIVGTQAIKSFLL